MGAAQNGETRPWRHDGLEAIRNLLVAPALACLKAPRLTAAVLVVALTVILAFSHLVRFDENMARAFSSQSPISRAYADFLDALGSPSQFVIVLAEADREPDADAIAGLRDLALELELDGAVDLVLSPFSVRFPRDGGAHSGEALIPFDPQPDAIRGRIKAYRARAIPVNPMITDDLRAAAIAVAVARPGGDGSYGAQLATVGSIMAATPVDGYSLSVTGEAAISLEIADGLMRDIVVLNSLGAALGIAAAWLIFRSVRAVACVVAPALAGMGGAFGVFVATGLPITVISNVVLVLVLVLGLADGSHLTAHLLARDGTQPLRDRIRATVEAVGPACALAALTTAIALGAIALTDNEPLREFGIVGALSTLVSYAFVVAGFVLCALVLDPSAKGRALAVPPFPRRITAAVLGHARPVIAAGLGLGAVATVGFMTTQSWFTIYENIPESSGVRRAGEVAEARFGGFFRFWAEFEGRDGMAPDTPEGWARLKAVTQAVAEAQPGATVLSAVTLARLAGSPDAMPAPDQVRDLPPMLADAFLDAEAGHARLLVLTPDPMRDEAALARYDAMEAAVREAGATRIAGLAALARHEPLSLIRQLSAGLFGACLICSVVVAAYFRRPALTWALVLPNVLPLAVTAAALHIIADGHMSPTALLALTVAFGVAVDDSIHYINRYMRGRGRGHDAETALLDASERTGQVMIVTTVIICSGLLATFLSDFSTVRQFGTMLILTFATALAADLLLLPALLKAGGGR